MATNFKWIDKTLMVKMAAFEPTLDRGLVALTERYGGIITDDAKASAPWTDRTGNARNGLETSVEHAMHEHRITLFHKVDYGIWLEIAHGGTYRVIMPTLDRQGRKLMGACKTLLRKMGTV